MAIYREPLRIYSVDNSPEVEAFNGTVRCAVQQGVDVNCGLLDYQFQVVGDGKVILEAQDWDCKMSKDCMFMKKSWSIEQSESAGSNCFIPDSSEAYDEEAHSNFESGDRTEEFHIKGPNLDGHPGLGSHLHSKLISQKILWNWLSWIKKKKKELDERGKRDEFELWTEDQGNEVRIKVWCVDCRETYGKGAADKARETLNNFCRTHLECKSHKENHARRVDGDGILKNDEKQDTLPSEGWAQPAKRKANWEFISDKSPAVTGEKRTRQQPKSTISSKSLHRLEEL